MIAIKVCGMKFPENIIEVAQLQPDYMGFIFYEKSPRFASDISIKNIPNTIKKVGVFVDESLENILQKIENYGLDLVQLHGHETVSFCKELKKKIPVIKAFSIDENFDFQILKAYENAVSYFLFDTKGTQPGGNGITFNWTILEKYTLQTPYFLSGGIGLQHTSAIKNFLKKDVAKYCIALDLNSQFEDDYGLKNYTKLKTFIQQMKTTYQADAKGFYGDFGGAFIPEMLYPNVTELKDVYLKVIESEAFQKEYLDLLKNYVGRPTPLYFANRLSQKYQTNIYLKREDLCHTGAHKINNTIGQILLAKHLGKTRIIAETGAGQHGVATATVCALMNMQCIVYMGKIDMERQAPNVARMKMLGAEVVPATSGSQTLKDATNEAIRDWINNPTDTFYIIGSVVGPHPYPDMVARFQSIISKEIKEQLAALDINKPTHVIACVGGGSNAAGAFYHFLDDEEVQLVAVEAAGKGVTSGESAATTQLGKTGIIHGSKTLLMQTPDGQITEPYSISAGLDYPGIGPLHAHLFATKRASFYAITDADAMEAGIYLTKTEGIIPAIESAHALAVLEEIKFDPNDSVVVNLSGRGDKDLQTYINYFNL